LYQVCKKFQKCNSHSFIQVLAASSTLFCRKFIPQVCVADKSFSFHASLYAAEFQDALLPYPQLNDATNTWICQSATVDGLEYRKSSYVAIGYDDEQCVRCGEILMLLIHGEYENVYVVCERRNTVPAVDVKLVQVVDSRASLVCIPLSEIFDIYPLEGYQLGSARYIALRHAFTLMQ
jgi:hypothetical protein